MTPPEKIHPTTFVYHMNQTSNDGRTPVPNQVQTTQTVSEIVLSDVCLYCTVFKSH